MTRAYIVSLVRRRLVLLLLILNAIAYCDGVEAKPRSRQVRTHGGGNKAGGGGSVWILVMARTFSSVGLADEHLKSHLPNGEPEAEFLLLATYRKKQLATVLRFFSRYLVP